MRSHRLSQQLRGPAAVPERVPKFPRLAAAVSAPLLALLAASVLWPGVGDRVRGDARSALRSASPSGPDAGAGSLGDRDGYIAVDASISPFSGRPALARLDPPLRQALRAAAADARADGITLRVNSGWRSARYQRTLFRRAVTTYGSVEVARQYVKPPEQSSHVTGRAVDIGPADAASWLSQHGGEFGLCQTYANERWHFERVTEPGGICPEMETNAAGAG